MQTYSGNIHFIGNGTWRSGANGEGGTLISVLEIGDKQLKRVYIPDYLQNYLKVGKDTRLLILKSTNNEAVLGLEVEGKTYKIERRLMLKYFRVKKILPAIFFSVIGAAATGSFGLEPGSGFIIGLSVYLLYARGKMKEFDRF